MAPGKDVSSSSAQLMKSKYPDIEYLGPSTLVEGDLTEFCEERKYFPERFCARAPPQGKTVQKPRVGEIVVFADFFKAGLRFPCTPFLAKVLNLFEVEIQQLHPNGMSQLAIFEWAIRTYV